MGIYSIGGQVEIILNMVGGGGKKMSPTPHVIFSGTALIKLYYHFHILIGVIFHQV